MEIKSIRDQHWSHIDRKRKNDTNLSVFDIIEIVKSFLEMFDLIHIATNGKSIFDLPFNIQLFDLKLKAFKYDMIMQYLNKNNDADLYKLKSMQLHSNFEDSYNALFM